MDCGGEDEESEESAAACSACAAAKARSLVNVRSRLMMPPPVNLGIACSKSSSSAEDALLLSIRREESRRILSRVPLV